MKKLLLTALGSVTALSFAPAQAATIMPCDGNGQNCVAWDQNVNIADQKTGVSTIFGTTNSGVVVKFTTFNNLLLGKNGTAAVSALDGVLETVTFELLNGATFGVAQFNLLPLNGKLDPFEGTSVVFNYLGGGQSGPFSLAGNGNNVFGVTANALTGERLTGLTFLSQPAGTGIGAFEQLRLGDLASAVPEPATWAMMLLGFGAIGFGMRRRRSKDSAQPRVRFAF